MENENKQNTDEDDDDEILFGFDCDEDFIDDGTTTADNELPGIKDASGSSTAGLVFVDAKQVTRTTKKWKRKSSNWSDENQSDEDIQPPQPTSVDTPIDIGININLNVTTPINKSPKSPRVLSSFKNDHLDIVSFGAAPLQIKDISIQNMNQDSLEYIQNAMPDLHSLYWNTVWAQIRRSQKQVKCINYRATQKSILNVMSKGGCKILQFMAHCCNPKELLQSTDESDENNAYKQLINKQMINSEDDYVLLECDDNIINGQWYDINQLRSMFNSQYNDIVIVLSPNYKKMVDIFCELGYKYIIGIKTFNENIEKHNRDKNNWKISVFLTRFYSAILDGECIDRSFQLAMTDASGQDINTQLVQAGVLKSLVSSESMMDELKQSETNFMQRQNTIGQNNRFILHIANDNETRFVSFHDYHQNDPIDVGNLTLYSSCAHLQYEIPFIGRSKELIELYDAITKYQIVSCIGRKNYGRRCVIIKLMNYLQQHRYFEHGVIIIDCEQEPSRYLFDDIMDDKLGKHFTNINGYYFTDILSDIKEQIPNASMCIVILNVDAWKNKYRDPREWIKQYALKMPKQCKCIYTDDGDNLINSFKKLPLTGFDSANSERLAIANHPSSENEYNKYIKAMQKFFTNTSTFTATNIDKLSNAKLSQLFMNLIAVNKTLLFDTKHIEHHKGLHKKFDGKARFVKRAAAWVSKLQTTEDMELTLDAIHDKLPDEWLSTTTQSSSNVPMTEMTVYHSHSISPFMNPNFQKHLTPSNLQQGYSILLQDEKSEYVNYNSNHSLHNINHNNNHNNNDHENENIDDTISKIRNATDISELKCYLEQKHLDALKQLLIAQIQSEIVNQSPKDITIQLSRHSLNLINYRSSVKSSASFIMTPPPPELRHDTPYPSAIPYPINMPYQMSIPISSNHTLPRLISVNSEEYRLRFDRTVDLNINASNKRESNTLEVPTIINQSDHTLPALLDIDMNSMTSLNSMHSLGSLQYGKTVEINISSYKLPTEEEEDMYNNNNINKKKKKKKRIKHKRKRTNVKTDSQKDTLQLQQQNNSRKIKHFAKNESQIIKILPQMFGSQSRKARHLINESQTISIVDVEAITTEDVKYNEFDNKIIAKMSHELQQIWRKECCNHNRNIAQLSNVQNVFNDKFRLITKFENKTLQLDSLNECYLKSFEIFKCDILDYKLVINISQFAKFWDWLESVCYLICKFKGMYAINDIKCNQNNYNINHEFGMLIGKQNANHILSKHENIKNGAFILYVDANKSSQINLLYRNCRNNTNNKLQEIVIKFNKKEKHYTIKNEKTDPIKYIKRTTSLKLFYLPKRKGLIRKFKVLKFLK